MIERLLPGVVRITTHRLAGGIDSTDSVSYGSGFIVDSAGFIVTNQHVVQDAYEIIVTQRDGAIAHARLVGTGGDVDLALLKIDARHQLESLSFGDSNHARIGDEVFAIGNPFGIGTTVTRGIISAVNRNLNRSIFDSYLQTDAAINRGNSGGPLINGKGEVIGVNTAYNRGMLENGGSIGLGFAIPSTVARAVVDLIRQYGRPRVGWLGVDGQTLTAEMADALTLDQKTGAILVAVKSDGPSAGLLEPDDIILEIDGHKLIDMRMLQRTAAASLGKSVRLKVLRRGKTEDVTVNVMERPTPGATSPSRSATVPIHSDAFGLTLSPLSDSGRRELGMAADAGGVLVADVAPISAAAEAGLSRGDVVENVQLRPVRTRDDVVQALEALAQMKRDFALLRVRSHARVRFVTLHLIWEGPNGAHRSSTR